MKYGLQLILNTVTKLLKLPKTVVIDHKDWSNWGLRNFLISLLFVANIGNSQKNMHSSHKKMVKKSILDSCFNISSGKKNRELY